MKTTGYILAGIACFVGVFAALQADRFLDKKKDADLFSAPKSSISGMPTAYEPAAPGSTDFRAAAKRVTASVVSVDRYQNVSRGWMDDGTVVRETGTGSGVVISDTGIIVTNNHVVEGATKVKVRLSDKRTFDAKVLGRDERSDIAVIKVEGGKLSPIELGVSSDLEVGQWVIAIGNPLGFDNTVSVGVVSSLKRNLPVGQQGLVDAIQTDAAINPGNSGGALCDQQGRLIGINSAIASSTGQSVGIGFAIPVDRVKKIASDIVKYGSARYAGLGVEYAGQFAGNLDNPYARREIAQAINREDFPSSGLLIVNTSGGAKSAGIKKFDFILAINGEPVETTFDLNRQIITKKVGEKVKVKIWSEGKEKTVDVTLQEITPRT